MNAYDEGKAAWNDFARITDNPYDYDSDEHGEWEQGFADERAIYNGDL